MWDCQPASPLQGSAGHHLGHSRPRPERLAGGSCAVLRSTLGRGHGRYPRCGRRRASGDWRAFPRRILVSLAFNLQLPGASGSTDVVRHGPGLPPSRRPGRVEQRNGRALSHQLRAARPGCPRFKPRGCGVGVPTSRPARPGPGSTRHHGPARFPRDRLAAHDLRADARSWSVPTTPHSSPPPMSWRPRSPGRRRLCSMTPAMPPTSISLKRSTRRFWSSCPGSEEQRAGAPPALGDHWPGAGPRRVELVPPLASGRTMTR